MKILQLCNKVPYPEKDGGAIAISSFTKELLRAGHSVKMLAMNTRKHYVEVKDIPEGFKDSIALETVDIDNSVNPLSAIMALLKGESYNISRFKSHKYAEKLQRLLQKEQYDLIQLEGLYLTPYIPIIRQYSIAPIVMRAHNVEYKIWERLALEEKKPLKKRYLTILANQLKRYEKEAINLPDGIITFTQTDLNTLKSIGCSIPLAHIPFGINLSQYVATETEEPNSLFYIGALDWKPNLQGIEWFLKEAWPIVHAKAPNVTLHIAGRNMPENMKSSNYPNIVFHGEVENAHSFMSKYGIMISPLLAGSGVRIKIIEGMALSKPIITTTIGIEGIECNYGKDVLVADTPEELSKTIVYCISNPNYTKQIATDGHSFAKQNHDIHQIVERLTVFYQERITAKHLK